jgi:hypothetical protein
MGNQTFKVGNKVVAVKAARVTSKECLEIGKIYTVFRVDAYDSEDLYIQLEDFPIACGWVTEEDIAPVVNLEEVLYG